MKTQTIAGIILITIGIMAFAYQGISYTSKKNVLDIGPIEMMADGTTTFQLPPMVGAVALLGGIVLLVVGKKNT